MTSRHFDVTYIVQEEICDQTAPRERPTLDLAVNGAYVYQQTYYSFGFFSNASRIHWNGLAHLQGVNAPRLGNPCYRLKQRSA